MVLGSVLVGRLDPAPPTGPGYDIVLLAHVGCAVAGFGTVVASGVQAARLRSVRPGEQPAPSLVSYFAPGTNWAGRLLYGVPVLGFVLIALSHGSFSTNEPWIVAGLLLWTVSALAAEMLLWPTERRIQVALAQALDPPSGAGRDRLGPEVDGAVALADALERARPLCRVVCAVSVALTVLFVAATVLMVAQP
jgi:hypothetical protein